MRRRFRRPSASTRARSGPIRMRRSRLRRLARVGAEARQQALEDARSRRGRPRAPRVRPGSRGVEQQLDGRPHRVEALEQHQELALRVTGAEEDGATETTGPERPRRARSPRRPPATRAHEGAARRDRGGPPHGLPAGQGTRRLRGAARRPGRPRSSRAPHRERMAPIATAEPAVAAMARTETVRRRRGVHQSSSPWSSSS